ncbi:MAG: hypothetical protein ACLTA5_07505 [Anaerococcus obesiensis]
MERDIFSYIEKYLKDLGLNRYEISNFSKRDLNLTTTKILVEGGYLALDLVHPDFCQMQDIIT